MMVLLLKNLLFTVLVPGTVAGWVPFWIVTRSGAEPGEGLGRLLTAATGGTIGVAVYAWCVWDFATSGRGTPAPIDPPKHLVRRGLYRHVRNPMYLGVLLVVAAWAVAFDSRDVALYWTIAAVVFHLVVVIVEEPILRRQFGEAYRAYCSRVPRWLPRLRRPGGPPVS